MQKRLDGKIALITGAGTGIGEAIAHKFAHEGAQVFLVGLIGDPVTDVVDRLRKGGFTAHSYQGDISLESEAERCVQKCVEIYGRLDILINNAGVFLFMGETEHFPTDVYEQTVRMNISSVFFMTRAALPYLQKTKGGIISAGSEAGMQGLAFNAVYGGTKAWIHAFMQGVAVEQGKHGVRANCICPGPVDTAWTRKGMGPMNRKEEKMTVQATAFGRRGTVEEIANVYAFLASDEASYVTGALWTVDGGITVVKGPIGKMAERDVSEEPPVTLPVQHTHDGLLNKDYGHN